LTSLLFSLLNAARRRRKAQMQSLRDMLKESLRYTAFLGSFAGVYVAVDESIAALLGKRRCAPRTGALAQLLRCLLVAMVAVAAVWPADSKQPAHSPTHLFQRRTSHWRAFVAGAAAGPSILLTGCAGLPS